MFPLGVVGGLQEITSIELFGEFVCKSLTGPDTGIEIEQCYLYSYILTYHYNYSNTVIMLTHNYSHIITHLCHQ